MNKIYRVESLHEKIPPLVILDNNICIRFSRQDIENEIKDVPVKYISFLPGVLEKNNGTLYSRDEWTQQRDDLKLKFPDADTYYYNNIIFGHDLYVSLMNTLQAQSDRLSIFREIYAGHSLKSLIDKKTFISKILNASDNKLDIITTLFLVHAGKNEELKTASLRVLKSKESSNKNALIDLFYLELLETLPSIILLTCDRGLAELSEILLKHRTRYPDKHIYKVAHSYDKFIFEPPVLDFFKKELIKRDLSLIDKTEWFTLTYKNENIVIILNYREDPKKNEPLIMSCNFNGANQEILDELCSRCSVNVLRNKDGLMDIKLLCKSSMK